MGFLVFFFGWKWPINDLNAYETFENGGAVDGFEISGVICMGVTWEIIQNEWQVEAAR